MEPSKALPSEVKPSYTRLTYFSVPAKHLNGLFVVEKLVSEWEMVFGVQLNDGEIGALVKASEEIEGEGSECVVLSHAD